MEPLDHKNLDKDVPYFAEVVRWVIVETPLTFRVFSCESCSPCGLQHLVWPILGRASSNLLAVRSESACFSLSAPQRTLRCSSGKTSRTSCPWELFIKSKCMKQTRTLLFIKEKKPSLRNEMNSSSVRSTAAVDYCRPARSVSYA